MIKNGEKPRFYENHQKIIDSTLLEPQQLALYLHENMLTHFNDIEDVANCLEVYSEVDGPIHRLDAQFTGFQAINDLECQAALIESMAITEFNEHCQVENRKMLRVDLPQIYECRRN